MTSLDNNIFGLTFHHMGLAVKKKDTALIYTKGLGYTAGEEIYDPEQDAHLILCTQEGWPSIEIVTPGKQEDGPLGPIFKRYNELMYHTCYETQDLDKTLQAWEEQNLRILLVSEPKPAILFGGRKVSFYTIMGFGLVELLEH